VSIIVFTVPVSFLCSVSKQNNSTARVESETGIHNVALSHCYAMNRIESNHDDDVHIYNNDVDYGAYMRRNQAQDQELHQRLRDLENREEHQYSLRSTTTSSSIPSSLSFNETIVMREWMNEKSKQVLTLKVQIMEQQMALLEKEIQLAMLHEKLVTQEHRMQEELNMMKELSQMENTDSETYETETYEEFEFQNHIFAMQNFPLVKDSSEGIQDLSEEGRIAENRGPNLQSVWNEERHSIKTLNANEAFPDPNVKIQPIRISPFTYECEEKQAPKELMTEHDWHVIKCDDTFIEVSDEKSNLSQSLSYLEPQDALNIDDSWDMIEGEEIVNIAIQNK
jgi:hypothetical protein